MIPVQRIPLNEIWEYKPLDLKALQWYIVSRPDVLEHMDIFYENCRSKDQSHKDFSLFKDDPSSSAILLFPIYLELYEFSGIDILPIIEEFSKRYYPRIVVFQWNHDVDFAAKYKKAGEISNARIINFNTSSPNPNDILVPFWAINTAPINRPKKHFAGFIGSLNYPLRVTLVNTIRDKPGYFIGSGMSTQTYLETMSECTFSLCPRGQGLSSYRFYECMHVSTVPVLLADSAVLPYPDINYADICLRVPEMAASDFNRLDGLLHSENPDTIIKNIESVKERFTLLGIQREIHDRLAKNL